MRNIMLGLAALAMITVAAESAFAEHYYGSRAAIHTVAHGRSYRYDDGHHGAYSSHGRSRYYPRYHGRYPVVPGHPHIVVPYYGHPAVVAPPVHGWYGQGCNPHRNQHNRLYYRGNSFGFSFSF